MANYQSACRSNYFKVGRPKEFMDWISSLPDVEFQAQNPDSPDLIGMVYGVNPDGAGWPTWREIEDEDGDYYEQEIDFFDELSQFLAPGEVAVFQEVGSEKLRYLYGQAVAVNHKGEQLSISLDNIYEQVEREWNATPSACSY